MSSPTDYAAKKVALEDALLSGELTVESDGDRVTYRSVSEIERALAHCERQIAGQSNMALRPATTIAAYSTR